MEDKISFARKYRPTSLEGYIGNQNVKDTVKRYLKNGRPQSILLTGNSGCGKTTMARLLVKEYLCENRDSETGSCGECMTCQAVDEYITTSNGEMLPDVYEFDATSEGSKGIGAMLDSMEYPPVAGDWKCYIVDEVHKLSDGAMSKLLKPLEEPPEGVLMIFCTTNPEKLLDTIKNRCQLKLQVTKPTTKDIVELLQRVCVNEDKDYDISGLRMIAGRSDNVIRDSLNNIERVLNTRGNATSVSVAMEFQEVSDKLVFDFYDAYLNKDYYSYINILYKIKTQYDFGQFLTTLTNFTTRGIYILNSVNVEGLSAEEIKSYITLFKSFSPKEISSILSSLRRMDVGDIEANFMSFIYTEIEENKEEVKSEITTGSIESERKFRNRNLENIEQSKLDEGTKSLNSELDSVSFSDVAEFFGNLEKVEE